MNEEQQSVATAAADSAAPAAGNHDGLAAVAIAVLAVALIILVISQTV